MFWKACLISLLVGALSTAAFAEQLLPVSPDVIQPQAEAALIIITTLITAYFAYAMFNEQSVNLDDGPMLPRYMTQPRQSIAAGITYVTMCIILYELGVYFFNDLLPLEELLPLGGITEAVRKFFEENGPTFTSRVILEAALFYALFQVNREWNPLLVLRRLVWSWVSVPQLANVIMNVARHALAVPDHARAEVVRHPDCSTVDISDFDKDRTSVDRRWAEICYFRLWLIKHIDEGADYTFFNEESFSWEKLETDFLCTRLSIVPLKRELCHGDRLDLKAVANHVGILWKQYCRLAALLLGI